MSTSMEGKTECEEGTREQQHSQPVAVSVTTRSGSQHTCLYSLSQGKRGGSLALAPGTNHSTATLPELGAASLLCQDAFGTAEEMLP